MIQKRIAAWFLILMFTISLSGCKNENDTGLAQLTGAYLYDGPVLGDAVYADQDEAPVFIFTESELIIFRRDLSTYSPRSSCGIYNGTYGTYSLTNVKEMESSRTYLNKMGVDTEQYSEIHGYVLSEGYLELYMLDGQVWVASYDVSAFPSVFRLTKSENLELQTVELNLARDDNEKVVLVDTQAPKMLNIEDETISKDDVITAIGESSKENGVLVAYQQFLMDHFEQYIVFEFDNDTLRSRAEYAFYDSYDIYKASKGPAVVSGGTCNDMLWLLKTTYAYDVELPVKYRKLNYDELKASLEKNGFTIIG